MTAAAAGALVPGVPLLLGLIGLTLPAGDRGEHQPNRGPAAALGIAGAAAALAVTLALLLFAHKPLDVNRRWVNIGGLEITLGFNAGLAAPYIAVGVGVLAPVV